MSFTLNTMDTIPDEIYQHIFGYLLGDTIKEYLCIWSLWRDSGRNYRLQLVNKTFQRNFRSYLKTRPLCLHLCPDEYSFQVVRALKRYDLSGIYSLGLEYVSHDIMKALDGFNFISLRELYLMGGEEFDYEMLKECKELTSITLGHKYVENLDEIRAEKLRSFLSFHKHTLECLYLHLVDGESFLDVIPKDLSWLNLKKFSIIFFETSGSTSKVIVESSTLQYLHITYDRIFPCDMVIKCPNLNVLLIETFDGPASNSEHIESKYRSPCKPYGESDEFFTETCHPNELRKIGIKVDEVSSHCDIGILL